jgi:hypothetical protein
LGTWTRQASSIAAINSGSCLLAAVPRGSTLQRIRFGWVANIVTSTLDSALNIQRCSIVFGIISGSSSVIADAVPDPATTPSDPSPPLSRWLWYESRSFYCTAYDSLGGVQTWRDTGPQETTDTRGMVSASVPESDTLDVYASWGTLTVPSIAGEAYINLWSSVLYD